MEKKIEGRTAVAKPFQPEFEKSCSFFGEWPVNRRLTHLTLGVSKKLEHLKNLVALSIAHYNFCRTHHSLQGETPAMAARLTDHVWTIAELLTESGANRFREMDLSFA